jgi:hypothetical protein
MSQFDCENLTKAISSLKSLNTRFDSVWSKLDIESSLLVQSEMQEMIINNNFEARLREVCGGVENLKERLIHLKISGNEKLIFGSIAQTLQSRMISVTDGAKEMMESEEFHITKKPRDIYLIILSAEEAGFDRDTWIEYAIEKAGHLGLELCPPDTGPMMLLKQREFEWLPKNTENLNIMMAPIESENMNHIFRLSLWTLCRISAYFAHNKMYTFDKLVYAIPEKYNKFLAGKYK